MSVQLNEQVSQHVAADTNYTEYVKFRDATEKRERAQADFRADATYLPAYEYPKLFTLYDVSEEGKYFIDKKRQAYEAVLELEARKDTGDMPSEEYELYASYHEVQLKRMMLTEAARRLNWSDDSSAQQTAREEFMALNMELFGDIDRKDFDAMMHTEAVFVENYIPSGPRAYRIRSELLDYFRQHSFSGEEQELMPAATLEALHQVVLTRYGDALLAVPETDDTVVYEPEECERILNACLKRTDLGLMGAQFKLTEGTAVPSTLGSKLLIKLPPNTRRTASQLKRLYVHEAEVHVRRAVNGKTTGVQALEKGTANYADVEEGLGVLLECALAGDLSNESFDRARERYIFAGLALGADGMPKDGRATYEIMWRLLALHASTEGFELTDEIIEKAKKKATIHEDNAFRGTNFGMPGILYSKLKMYYEGLKKNADYFLSDPQTMSALLDHALIAKYDHTSSEESALVDAVIASHDKVA